MSIGLIYKHFTSLPSAPHEGALQVWWIPQVPGKSFDWRVDSLREASHILDMLAAYDDFQFAENVKGDYSNVGGLHIYKDGEWVDWESDDGDDFDTWRESNKTSLLAFGC